jgi:hypothetical protein
VTHCGRVAAALAAWFLHNQDPKPTVGRFTDDRLRI